MLLINILTISIQINRLFFLKDIQHIISQRDNRKAYSFEYLDIDAYNSFIQTTKIPKFATLSYFEDCDRLHIFVHDKKIISRCVWDGEEVSLHHKKKVIENMLTWWIQNNHSQFEQRQLSYEDGIVFSEAIKDVTTKE